MGVYISPGSIPTTKPIAAFACFATMAVSLKHLIQTPPFSPSSTLRSPSRLYGFLIKEGSSAALSAAASWCSRIKRTTNRFRIPFSRSIVRYNDGYDDDDDDDEDLEETWSFDEAVALFNNREFYDCHDAFEFLWIKSEEPSRTLIHGILQCAVGFHHLFNHNHKGAMMELGEGVCKLRKMNFENGPFLRFEEEISAVLDFVYQTQIELAACTDQMCLAIDQSEKSYELLGGYAAGQNIYSLKSVIGSDETEGFWIVFCPNGSYHSPDPPKVKLPLLDATEKHLVALAYDSSC